MKKLRNKKTGDIGFLICVVGPSPEKIKVVECIDGKRGSKCWYYDTITELNEEWEDYEEPKGHWFIDCAAPYPVDFCEFNEDTEYDKEIGNYFETKEEAEKVVEKLKAWKRLKDKGFRFVKVDDVERVIHFEIPYRVGYDSCEAEADLDTCFGGEE